MKRDLLAEMREGKNLNRAEQLLLIFKLALPGILAQISSIIMQYIDASMVGRLGAAGAASIGLVSSSTWLFADINIAVCIGFSVQVAQNIGAVELKEARNIMKQSMVVSLIFGLVVGLLGVLVSKPLPILLGGNPDITPDATRYFFVFSCALQFSMIRYLAGSMIQSTGNMKVPSAMNILMCFLDVVFNMFFIFPTRAVGKITVPGLGLGVMGASLGTASSEVVVAFILVGFMLFKSSMLKLRKEEKLKFKKENMKRAIKIGAPIGFEQIVTTGAQVFSTRIVSPLGTMAIAANSFAVTAESLCYMPGYGLAAAATTLIGQSIGAKRDDLTRRFGWMTTILGMIMMALTGAAMYFAAPFVLGILSTDPEVVALGVTVLRIELLAEPLFAASIVANGVFRGSGDTLIPSVIHFLSMWVIRIPLAWFLSLRIGLRGVWVGMAVQLSILGIIFLVRLAGRRWQKPSVIEQE